jgi:hypothetical protein
MNPAPKNPDQTRGRPFQPGNSFGKGRPAGSRNKATLFLEALIEGEGEAVVQVMAQQAKAGNMTAAKALLDRLVPPRKAAPTPTTLAEISAPADLAGALVATFNAMATGDLTPDEAQTVTNVVIGHIRAHEMIQIEQRLAQLEKSIGHASTVPPTAAD